MAPSSKAAGRSGDAPVQIRRMHEGENVHARLKGFAVNMRNLGGITLGQGQSPHMGAIHLSTEIALGFVRVPIAGRSYEWSMSGVTIAVDVENARVVSYYRDVLQEAGIEAAEQDADKASLDASRQGAVAAEAGAGWKGFPLAKIFATAQASAKRDAKHVRTSEASTKVTPVIVFVERQGDRTLRAGGGLAERLRPATRDLRGVIVSPFRRAAPSGARGKADLDEVATPLVRLEAIDPGKPVVGWVSVRAEKEDFVLDASKGHEQQATLLHEGLKKDKADWLKRRGEAEASLRRRVAALAALKAVDGYDNKAGADEIDLFCCSFCFEPAGDGAEDPAGSGP